MSSTSHRRQRRPSTRSGQLEARRGRASSRAAGWRCRRAAPRRGRRRGAGRPSGRRSGGRPPACRRGRAPRRSTIRPRSRTGAKTAERGPTQTWPRRCAAAATRRSARPAPAPSAGRATGSPSRAREARDRLRGQTDLGDEHDRAPAAGERRLDRGEVDLGLARAGDAVQQQIARCSGLAVERRGDRRDGPPLLGAQRRRSGRPPPPTRPAGRRRNCDRRASRSAPAPRDGGGSRGRRPAAAASSEELRSPARASASSTARCRGPSALRSGERGAARRGDPRPAARVFACTALPPGARPRRQHQPEAPGRGRAVLLARSRARGRTSSAGAPASSASRGSAKRAGRSRVCSATSTTTPRIRRRPNGIRRTLPTPTSAIASGRR